MAKSRSRKIARLLVYNEDLISALGLSSECEIVFVKTGSILGVTEILIESPGLKDVRPGSEIPNIDYAKAMDEFNEQPESTVRIENDPSVDASANGLHGRDHSDSCD